MIPDQLLYTGVLNLCINSKTEYSIYKKYILGRNNRCSIIVINSTFFEFKLLKLKDLSKIVNTLKNKSGSKLIDTKYLKSTCGVLGHVLFHFISIYHLNVVNFLMISKPV